MVATFEYIEDVIATFEQATQANLRTPTREGNVVVLTPDDADELMVTADLHGHRRNFNSIRRIASLDEHPRRHLVMQEVCHGGPTYSSNGGDMSHAMLEDVARLKVRFGERFHFLLSNHELAELTDYPILKNRRMLNLLFRMGMQEAYGAAAEKVRQAMLGFLRSCPLAVRTGSVFICHSAPAETDREGFDASVFDRPLEPADLQEHAAVFSMVWGRDYRPENARAFARLVRADVLVHGHEPCSAGYHVPNDTQVIIDCCGDKATYLLLPVGRQLSQAEVVSRIRPLT